MKKLLLLLLLFALTDCAGLKQARRARQVAGARAVLREYGAATPPAEQLSDLLRANPELEGQRVRVVKERDTIRVPGATVTVTLPAESSPAADQALVDSLMQSVAHQLHAKDSAAYAQRLRALLASRPKLSRDTVTRQLGPIAVRLWTDAQGRAHAQAVKAPQQVAYEKVVTETGPVVVKRELAFWDRVWLFIKDAFGLIVAALVCVAGVWLFFFIRRQRAKQPTA